MLEFIRSSYFKGLLSSFSAGVVIFNEAGDTYAVNEAAIRILGLDENRTTAGRPWQELFTGIEEPDRLSGIVARTLEEKKRAGPITARLVSPKGPVRFLTLHASVLVYYHKIWGVVVEINDVTPIYELHAREKSILEEKRCLENERTQALHRFSMALAHQILNPTTIIGGMARLLLKRRNNGLPDPEEKTEDILARILDGTRRLEAIVAAVNEYTAIRVGEKSPTDICLIISEVRASLDARYPEKTLYITWKTDCRNIIMPVDRPLFQAAVAEIVQNSMDAFEGQVGSISIRAAVQTGQLEMEIRDNGPGIPENALPFALDPFFSTKPHRVGMGLCKAERIIREHGGRLGITSRPGEGTAVTITLPLGSVSLPPAPAGT